MRLEHGYTPQNTTVRRILRYVPTDLKIYSGWILVNQNASKRPKKCMKKTNLLVCPNCRSKNNNPIPIGELTAEGCILINRHVNRYTVVEGKEFAILCGECSAKVFYREPSPVIMVMGTP